jgi:hypothetical protein
MAGLQPRRQHFASRRSLAHDGCRTAGHDLMQRHGLPLSRCYGDRDAMSSHAIEKSGLEEGAVGDLIPCEQRVFARRNSLQHEMAAGVGGNRPEETRITPQPWSRRQDDGSGRHRVAIGTEHGALNLPTPASQPAGAAVSPGDWCARPVSQTWRI